jgi:hypothetical protein
VEVAARDLAGGWHRPQWWPTVAALAFAGFVALDLFRGAEHGSELAPIVAASGLVYLAAAATGKPGAAWWMFFACVPVIAAAETGWVDLDATWVLLAIAGLIFGYGLLRGAARTSEGFPLQTIAMVAFGAVAALTLYMDEVAGAYLVAAGLFAHAGWDLYHHRANKVVARSMAEFCFVLDSALAAAIIVTTAS